MNHEDEVITHLFLHFLPKSTSPQPCDFNNWLMSEMVECSFLIEDN